MAIEPTRSKLSRRLTGATTVVVLLGLASSALLVLRHDAATQALGLEAYKIVLQFLLVAVLGGGVTLVFHAFNREAELKAQRSRQEEERALVLREARQRHLRELVEQYNVVKRARRMLRAQALVSRPGQAGHRVRVAKYDELLQVILDAQLSMETMRHVVRADDKLFPAHRELAGYLNTAADCLRSLLTEYEDFLPGVHADEAEVDLAKLPKLADLVGPYEESEEFRELFVHPVHRALTLMQHQAIVAAG
ncbi:hypothetical protein [Amycolatopsis lexingtonensis]|uniref:hypothetical protein n=1 Tax=Amycolatopsis lexingtonensis TaxID=218822 RepID=UPI003F716F8A